MAATTKFLQLRPVFRPTTTSPTSILFFSSSSNTVDPNQNSPQTDPTTPAPPPSPPQPPPPPQPPQSQSPFSSYFSDVKASLKKPPQGNPQSPPLRSHFGFSSSSSSTPNAPRSIGNVQEMLSEFRRRSAVPPPSPPSSPPQTAQHFSFQELYQQKVVPGGQDSSSAVSKSGKKQSLDAIRESLRQLRPTPAKNEDEKVGQRNDAMSLSKFKESLKLKPGDQSGRDSPMVIGGTDKLPLAIFGKEMREKDAGSANAAEFVRTYSHMELGEKLRSLRPEKKGEQKDWFSLEELNERLMKLREQEKEEGEAGTGSIFRFLKGSLEVLQNAKDQSSNNTMQRLDVLSELGSTESFMLSPPQEHLVEKYFHPDNMSASEKLKLELKKVRDEFKLSESDCGSARVQVAQLTTKIKHLATVLHKKDKHSRKGLQGMVQKRKSLLKYLRRTDWESYCFVLSKLGLRDNPDYKN